jgi:hypothetical protein
MVPGRPRQCLRTDWDGSCQHAGGNTTMGTWKAVTEMRHLLHHFALLVPSLRQPTGIAALASGSGTVSLHGRTHALTILLGSASSMGAGLRRLAQVA